MVRLLLALSVAMGVFFFSAALKAEIFTVMHYNVENLFDTIDDFQTNDQEFTPTGRAKWTEAKLKQKFKNLAKVVRSVNEGRGPAILTLNEVENESVLKGWARSELKDLEYKHAITDGNDARGINVAILSKFPFQSKPKSIRVSSAKTRDLLWAVLDVHGSPFHVIAVHWPSRRGGEAAAKLRMKIAKRTYALIGQLLEQDPEADIIVSGDLNDEPEDPSLTEGLRATLDLDAFTHQAELTLFSAVNTVMPFQKLLNEYRDGNSAATNEELSGVEQELRKRRSTYFYHVEKRWNAIDQIVLSPTLVDRARVDYVESSFKVIRLAESVTPDGHPKSTAKFGRAGYSDHFPITAQFKAGE